MADDANRPFWYGAAEHARHRRASCLAGQAGGSDWQCGGWLAHRQLLLRVDVLRAALARYFVTIERKLSRHALSP